MTATPHRPGDDDARDAHLVAALRHAPDRDLAPPDALSQRILAQARAHAQGSTRRAEPSRAGVWQRALDALFGRLQLAAAFGTVAVATLVGVMWSTREPAQEPPQARAPVAPPADIATPPAAPDVVPSLQGATERTNPPRREAAARPAPAAPSVLADAPTGRAKSVESRAEVAAQRSRLGQAAPSRAESTAAVPVQERSADAAAGGNAVGAVVPRPSPAAAAEARRDSLGAAAPAALKAAAPPIDPLARMDALLGAGAPLWQVAGRSVPHGPVQGAWWAMVSNATRGRWQRDEADGAAVATWLTMSSGAAPSVVLWIDGPSLRLRLGAEQWKAALPEATLQEWQAAVARW